MIDNILDELKREYERAVYAAYKDGREEVEKYELAELLEILNEVVVDFYGTINCKPSIVKAEQYLYKHHKSKLGVKND